MRLIAGRPNTFSTSAEGITASLSYTASQTGTFYVSAAHSYSSDYTNYTGTYTVSVGGGAARRAIPPYPRITC